MDSAISVARMRAIISQRQATAVKSVGMESESTTNVMTGTGKTGMGVLPFASLKKDGIAVRVSTALSIRSWV